MVSCDGHEKRRNNIPVIYTAGTHYEVGYDVGKTFRHMIQEFLDLSKELQNSLLPTFESTEGRSTYELCLNQLNQSFPQYVRELQGVADGADVEFHKLFLLHLDQLMIPERRGPAGSQGCSTVCLSSDDQVILGHTEDALPETLNHCYIVCAHIKEESPQGKWKVQEEKFSALCYAGNLPGFCMGYNHHGLVFSINVLTPNKLLPGKTPRQFLTRALLSAPNMERAQQILRDKGVGSGDGFSVNLTFLKQDGDRLFHNVEVGPAYENDESDLSVLTVGPGEHYLHCNKYLRLEVEEAPESLAVTSSDHRHITYSKFAKPCCCGDVKDLLGDQTDPLFCFFREGGEPDFVKTICTGIFDLLKQTWSLYVNNPKNSSPLIVMPLDIL